MKSKIIRTLFAGALTFTAIGAFAGVAIHNRFNEQPVKVEAGEGNYYSGISDTLTGTDLLNALHTLNNQKRTKTIGYQGMRQFAAKSDIDPDGSGKIIGFYDNKKVGPSWDSGSTWNREHVWPNVRDGDKVEDDAHMVRPAAVSTNSDRGSKGYGSDSYDPGEFVPYYRGAAARIIFYAAIADTSLKVVDYSFPYNGVSGGNHGYDVGTMGSLSEMLKWNLQYLPSDTTFTGANDLARRTELNRNEVIQTASGGQGNRNPFIDHPEYACKIWGDTNDKTRAICGGQVTPPDEPDDPLPPDESHPITLNIESKNLAIGESFDLIATTLDSSDVNWVYDEYTCEILNFGTFTTRSGEPLKVTAIKNGTTTFTATSGSNSVSCTIVCGTGIYDGSVEPDKPNNDEKNKTSVPLPLIIGIAAGVVLIAGVVVLVVVLTRKKKRA